MASATNGIEMKAIICKITVSWGLATFGSAIIQGKGSVTINQIPDKRLIISTFRLVFGFITHTLEFDTKRPSAIYHIIYASSNHNSYSCCIHVVYCNTFYQSICDSKLNSHSNKADNQKFNIHDTISLILNRTTESPKSVKQKIRSYRNRNSNNLRCKIPITCKISQRI